MIHATLNKNVPVLLKNYRMTNVRHTLLILGSVTFSLGFADCHFKATEVVYTLDPCPPKDFRWVNLIQSKNGNTIMERLKYKENALEECKKLVRYEVRTKFKKTLFNNIDWTTSNIYVGLLVDNKCELLVGVPLIGAAASDKQIKETVSKITEEVPSLLFETGSHRYSVKLKTMTVIGDREDTIAWCRKLPLPEISQ